MMKYTAVFQLKKNKQKNNIQYTVYSDFEDFHVAFIVIEFAHVTTFSNYLA